jgi:hypothetical protein
MSQCMLASETKLSTHVCPPRVIMNRGRNFGYTVYPIYIVSSILIISLRWRFHGRGFSMMRTESTSRRNETDKPSPSCVRVSPHTIRHFDTYILSPMETVNWSGPPSPPPHLLIFLLFDLKQKIKKTLLPETRSRGEQGRNPRLYFESLVKSKALNVHTKKSEHFRFANNFCFPALCSKSLRPQLIWVVLSCQRFGRISKRCKTCLWNEVGRHFNADLSYHALKSNGAMKRRNAWPWKLAYLSGKSSLWVRMWRFYEMRSSMMLSFTNGALRNLLWLLLRCCNNKDIRSPQRFIPFICI